MHASIIVMQFLIIEKVKSFYGNYRCFGNLMEDRRLLAKCTCNSLFDFFGGHLFNSDNMHYPLLET